MASSIPVLINRSSGHEKDQEMLASLTKHFRHHNLPVDIIALDSGDTLIAGARRAVQEGHPLIIAGGGDGTINAVASAVVGTACTLGVLPLGTLNHFAKDLQIPLELAEAVHCIAAGHTVAVDVGEVQDRIFLNNSGLGLYPEIVQHREAQEQRLGRSKWVAFTWALGGALTRLPLLQLHIATDKEELVRQTPLLFIGNNDYTINGFALGSRARLDRGHLSIYLTPKVGRLSLVWLALRAMLGLLHQGDSFEALTAREVWIETRPPKVHVSIDGEVCAMQSPLHYRLSPGALRVIVPASQDQTSST
jgi:YegS/Rv2252/BmrU family lipid kinase